MFKHEHVQGIIISTKQYETDLNMTANITSCSTQKKWLELLSLSLFNTSLYVLITRERFYI